jgi:hypothetical protein
MTMTGAAMAETEEGSTAPRVAARRPQRRCIVTRSTAPKTGLLRCVVGPDGTLVPDASERLPGRGFWVTADRDVIETALKKRNFEKVAGGGITVPADLADQAASQVERQCLALLGLARRAGVAVTGHDRVAGMIGKGRAGILLSASDGAPDGLRRMEAAAGETPVVALFDRDQLSLAFGGGNVVHAAIERGNMAARILRETTRLAALRVGRNRR